MRVIVADDAGYIVELLKDMLVSLGHQVIAVACDGQEAAELTIKLKPELLFLDLVMPEMNGVEVIHEILKSNADQKIIVCSSVSEKWVLGSIPVSSNIALMKKPFNKNDISNAIQSLMTKEKEVKYG